MNEQAVIALIALVLGALNVWGVFMLNAIARKFEMVNISIERLADKLDKLIPREEANDRFREHSESDGKRFDSEQKARHELAGQTNTQLLNHERRITINEERTETLREEARKDT